MKRNALLFIIAFGIVFGGSSLTVLAKLQERTTLLVVPARYSVLQAAFDMAARYSVVFVSYQGDVKTSDPLLHAWNGEEWVRIAVDDFVSGKFVKMKFNRAILVGDDELLPSPLHIAKSPWCLQVDRVHSIDTADIINACSKFFSFNDEDWRWFTERYNLTLKDANAELRKKSWYDRSSYEDRWTPTLKKSVFFKKRSKSTIRIKEAQPAIPDKIPSIKKEDDIQVEELPPIETKDHDVDYFFSPESTPMDGQTK